LVPSVGLLFGALNQQLIAQGTGTTRTEPSSNSTTSVARQSSAIENSVVKVFSVVRYPDLAKPWAKQSPVDITGSGVVIEGKRILTCAHVVLYASQVQVQANQSGDKLAATVEAIAPGIDLAVLKLEDETFFDSHRPLPRLRGLPEGKDTVLAYGYPKGGTSLSITKGIISRIEFAVYHRSFAGLRVQIDAAINPGNSGGPAVVGVKMVGLAFASLGNAQNIGYVIPNEEIDYFLQNVKDGRFDGKPAIYDECQAFENVALRAFLGLDKTVQGVVVHRPDQTEANYPLKKWDVITRIGDTPLDDQGMVKLRPDLRVFFKYMVQKVARAGKVPLTIMRGGQEMKVEVPIATNRPVVIRDLMGRYPSFFVYGPLVFSTATTEFVGSLARGNAGGALMGVLSTLGSPLVKRLADKPMFEGEELVIVACPPFPHRLSKGYGNPAFQVVKSVNGIPIKNLAHLVAVLRDATDKYLNFEYDNLGGETMVFPRADMSTATEEILSDNGIRTQGSPDLMSIWNLKRAQ